MSVSDMKLAARSIMPRAAATVSGLAMALPFSSNSTRVGNEERTNINGFGVFTWLIAAMMSSVISLIKRLLTTIVGFSPALVAEKRLCAARTCPRALRLRFSVITARFHPLNQVFVTLYSIFNLSQNRPSSAGVQ